MKKILFIILVIVILGACGQQNNEDLSNKTRSEGTIVYIQETFSGDRYYLLALPNVEGINYLEKTKDELIKLAQENDGAYYDVSKETFKELHFQIGDRIVGYYDAVGESDPPVYFIDQIEIISKE